MPARVEVDVEQVRDLAAIGCTVEEIADVMRVSKRTLETRKECKRAIESGRLQCRSSLRRLQYKAAQAGNITMQIWLGKQLLGQKDKTEQSADESQMNELIDAIRRS